MAALTRYRVSEKSLAVARTINEVGEICNYYQGIAKAAHKLNDRDAEIEAADFIMRAKRKLGVMMGAARKAGALAKGGGDQRSKHRGKKTPVKPSLADAGVDKNLAKDARKMGSISETEFKQRMDGWRKSVNGDGGKISTKLPAPPRAARAPSKRRADNISLKEWEKMSADERKKCLQRKDHPSDAPMNTQEGPGIEWAQPFMLASDGRALFERVAETDLLPKTEQPKIVSLPSR